MPWNTPPIVRISLKLQEISERIKRLEYAEKLKRLEQMLRNHNAK